MNRLSAALVVLVLLAPASAVAQEAGAALVGAREPSLRIVPIRRTPPDFRMPDGDLRRAGQPQQSGLIGAIGVGDGVQIGFGRFRVPEVARPRTHMETERHPAAVRSRDRGIAAIGISFRF